MTNKPMLSVERELRALAEKACGTAKDSPEYRRFLEEVSPTIVLDLTAEPAAQQHGEPVAWQYITHPTWDKGAWPTEWTECTKEAHDDYVRAPLIADWEYLTRKLYAEQPAPVAVMPEPYSLAMFQMISGFDSVTPEQFDLVWSACRAEMGRLNGVKL